MKNGSASSPASLLQAVVESHCQSYCGPQGGAGARSKKVRVSAASASAAIDQKTSGYRKGRHTRSAQAPGSRWAPEERGPTA